jgi:hypothetical protein
MRKYLSITYVCALMFLSASVPARADPYTFNFNSMPGTTASDIQSYMTGLLGTGKSVTVTGAIADQNYNGDGHVVGPCMKNGNVVNCTTPGSTPVSVTLGTSDGTTQHLGSYDTFLMNNSPATTIGMTFAGLKIYSVSFDYEIFPDGTCQTSSCGTANWPDFTFQADGTLVFRTLAITPGTAGSLSHSPNSGRSSTEGAPQFLGQSGLISLNGVTKLEFIDWPRTIGIDNLIINTTPPELQTPQTAPEPASIVLFGSLLLVTSNSIRRKRLS